MTSSIESFSSITESSLINGPDSSTASNCQQLMTEGRSPMTREKVSEDGYHWRKYGQKVVKGNEFVRSYYRCTYPNCQVKKQLECSHGGKIADIVYFGQHDHPKSLFSVPVPVLDDTHSFIPSDDGGDFFSTSIKLLPRRSLICAGSHHHPENRLSSVASCDDAVSVKPLEEINECRRKKKPCEGKATGETRIVVRTLSEVDIVNDGQRWRKYGQKMVKGNQNPRSYYRCSFPGCPVKKQVERASHDPKLVLTSYEGDHEHDMPPARTVSVNNGGSRPSVDDASPIKRKGEQIDTDHISKAPFVI